MSATSGLVQHPRGPPTRSRRRARRSGSDGRSSGVPSAPRYVPIEQQVGQRLQNSRSTSDVAGCSRGSSTHHPDDGRRSAQADDGGEWRHRPRPRPTSPASPPPPRLAQRPPPRTSRPRRATAGKLISPLSLRRCSRAPGQRHLRRMRAVAQGRRAPRRTSPGNIGRTSAGSSAAWSASTTSAAPPTAHPPTEPARPVPRGRTGDLLAPPTRRWRSEAGTTTVDQLLPDGRQAGGLFVMLASALPAPPRHAPHSSSVQRLRRSSAGGCDDMAWRHRRDSHHRW